MARSIESGTRVASAVTTGPASLGSRERELVLRLPDELIDAIAERAAMVVADRPARGEDGWLRGADQIAAYLDCPRSRVYALTSARRIPVHRDGSALVARRSELDSWLRNGGGLRP